jgi:hypothetical protein
MEESAKTNNQEPPHPAFEFSDIFNSFNYFPPHDSYQANFVGPSNMTQMQAAMVTDEAVLLRPASPSGARYVFVPNYDPNGSAPKPSTPSAPVVPKNSLFGPMEPIINQNNAVNYQQLIDQLFFPSQTNTVTIEQSHINLPASSSIPNLPIVKLLPNQNVGVEEDQDSAAAMLLSSIRDTHADDEQAFSEDDGSESKGVKTPRKRKGDSASETSTLQISTNMINLETEPEPDTPTRILRSQRSAKVEETINPEDLMNTKRKKISKAAKIPTAEDEEDLAYELRAYGRECTFPDCGIMFNRKGALKVCKVA